MKLSDFKADYQWFSAKASDVARQLALSGFAVIWVFKVDWPGGVARVPAALLGSALFLAVSLGLDLIHYLVATVIWGTFHRYHEQLLKADDPDPDLRAPRYLNWPTHGIFVLKQIALIWAWAGILRYLFLLWRSP
ncbi:MAG TPA: hypothetical protein VHR45_02875 [Thermoanaerobaculia bacterium]|nr:hypothetical protein [Thermoanaerobaculia bacterium]